MRCQGQGKAISVIRSRQIWRLSEIDHGIKKSQILFWSKGQEQGQDRRPQSQVEPGKQTYREGRWSGECVCLSIVLMTYSTIWKGTGTEQTWTSLFKQLFGKETTVCEGVKGAKIGWDMYKIAFTNNYNAQAIEFNCLTVVLPKVSLLYWLQVWISCELCTCSVTSHEVAASLFFFFNISLPQFSSYQNGNNNTIFLIVL